MIIIIFFFHQKAMKLNHIYHNLRNNFVLEPADLTNLPLVYGFIFNIKQITTCWNIVILQIGFP